MNHPGAVIHVWDSMPGLRMGSKQALEPVEVSNERKVTLLAAR